MKVLLSYILFLIFISVSVHAQQNDSLTIAHRKDSLEAKRAVRKAIYGDARKATIMSACVPGLGQIYNGRKSWWKAPIIYAALGGVGYFGVTNQLKYKYYSDNLRLENDGDPSTVNTTGYNTGNLITLKNQYRKYRDISIMVGALVYLVNIIDANVDAHLKTFDISDDLSLQVNPYSNFDYNNKLLAGLTMKLNFK